MQVDLPVSVWGRGYWKMNVAVLKEQQTLNDMKAKWAVWRLQRRNNTDVLTWWVTCIKRQLRKFFIYTGAERRRDREKIEHIYCLMKQNKQDLEY